MKMISRVEPNGLGLISPPQGFTGGMCSLPQWGVISAAGPEARFFLHGQLSQDLLLMQPNQGRFAVYCSPQGRVLASLYVLAMDEEQTFLLCERSVLEVCLKRLSMFVLRAKVRLSDAGAYWQVCGRIGSLSENNAAPWSYWCEGNKAQHLALYPALGCARSLVLVPKGTALALAQNLQPVWDWLQVQSGVASISDANFGKYLPQMLNYESVGGVNFKKGCYPGQEVVARSQFRGQVKRRSCLLHSTQALEVGAEIFADQQRQDAVGNVVQVAANPWLTQTSTAHAPLFTAIACLKNSAAAQPALYAQSGASVQPAPMPYALLDDI